MDQSQNSSSFQDQFIQDSDTQKHEKENKISLEKDTAQDSTSNSIKIDEGNDESDDDDFSLYLGWMYFLLGLHLLILIVSIAYKSTSGIIDGVIGSGASALMVLAVKRTDSLKAKLAKFLFLIETFAIVFLIYTYNQSLNLDYLDPSEEIYNEEESTPLVDAGKRAIIVLVHLICNVYTTNKVEKLLKHKEDQIREKLCNDTIVTTI